MSLFHISVGWLRQCAAGHINAIVCLINISFKMQTFDTLKPKYVLSLDTLHKIRNGFVEDMAIALNSTEETSTCKMLPSRVTSIPDGTEQGIYYALDWGGTNVRIIRMELFGINKSPKINSISFKIPSKYKKCSLASELFDFAALSLSKFMQSFKEHILENNQFFDVGFTFSFALKQTKLNEGVLITWNKGFNIDGVIGRDIVILMNLSFEKYKIPAKIRAICNDTVGTLLSCSYYHGSETKIGVIIGTGTNAAYIEPAMKDEIINTEWCYFDSRQNTKYLARVAETDVFMDTYTTNQNEEFVEKMVSGMYIPELVRLIFLQIFGEKVSSASMMLQPFGAFTSKDVGDLLKYHYDMNYDGMLSEIVNDKRYGFGDAFDGRDCKIFGAICELIVNRSADLIAALLLGILQRIKFFEVDNEGMCTLKNDEKSIVIGADGSVFLKMPKHAERLRDTMRRLAGDKVVEKVRIVHAEDGSGIGAALCVAAWRRDVKQKHAANESLKCLNNLIDILECVC